MIATEHPLKIDKAASAVLTGVLCWTLLVLGKGAIWPEGLPEGFIDAEILHHVGEIGEILFFLLGAMTIVELVDAHNGFDVVTSKINTTNRVSLLWIVGVITFLFSSVLDNLTTAIVMAALLKKILKKKEDIWYFAGIVVIAANAGGAWSPIGDVTTIMLWIGGQVSAANIVLKLFLPSLVCLIVPLTIASFSLKGQIEKPDISDKSLSNVTTKGEEALIFWMGILGLLFVPIFKSYTHLPPFMGMLLSLSILWITTEIIHRKKDDHHKYGLSVSGVVRKIDTPSILFFLGILLAVASLQTAGQLGQLSMLLDKTFGNVYAVNIIIGLFSSIVDNVPLVAGAIGMYPLSTYAVDHNFWELLAFCAGTGGSALIIGSAAGVAVMGILKIDFLWYMKKISLLAIAGYFSGIFTYYLINSL
jgi:Na+/H+ antiporter NhaD/arsenite permease-like protein